MAASLRDWVWRLNILIHLLDWDGDQGEVESGLASPPVHYLLGPVAAAMRRCHRDLVLSASRASPVSGFAGAQRHSARKPRDPVRLRDGGAMVNCGWCHCGLASIVDCCLCASFVDLSPSASGPLSQMRLRPAGNPGAMSRVWEKSRANANLITTQDQHHSGLQSSASIARTVWSSASSAE